MTEQFNWQKFAKTMLVGRKIVKVTYDKQPNFFDEEEYPEVFAIHLDDGQILIPSSDEEGNSTGVLFTNTGHGMFI
jgi:hypothetical protein